MSAPDPTAFDAVLFDMDGTLVDTEGPWFEAERDLASRYGVTLPDEAREVLHGADAYGLVTILRDRYGLDADPYAFLDALRGAVADRLGRAPARQGAEDLVLRVVEAGVPRALVSNSPHEAIRATLAAHAWAEHLRLRVSVDDVARAKPHPDAYLAAADRLGVAPAGCLVIEDSVAGVTAAVRAGTTCVAVTHGEVPERAFHELTPHVVSNLCALLAP